MRPLSHRDNQRVESPMATRMKSNGLKIETCRCYTWELSVNPIPGHYYELAGSMLQSSGRCAATPVPPPFFQSQPPLLHEQTGSSNLSFKVSTMNYLPPVSVAEHKMPVLDCDLHTEDSDGLLKDSESVYSWTYTDSRHRWNHGFWRTIGLTIVTSALSCLAGLFIGYQHHHSDEICSRRTSHYSTVMSNIPIKYHRQRFNGSLLKENIFRQTASPEVDAAWESLGVNYRPISVPVEDAARSGIAPDQVQINEAYGGGYPGNVEGLHHLHCLNLLRQSLYYNYDYYNSLGTGAFKNEDFIVRYHVSHCLDIIRQQLMCTVDVGVLGQVWVHPDKPSAFVDFNTEHQCRNFEQIRDWAESHQLPEHVPKDFLRPPREGDRIYSEIP